MYNRQRIKSLLTLLGGALFVLLMFGSCEGCGSTQYSPPEQQDLPGNGTGTPPRTPPRTPPHTPPRVKCDKGGLPNLGNTCFLNSALQILAALYANKVEEATKTLTDKQAKQLAVTCHKVIEGINANEFVKSKTVQDFIDVLKDVSKNNPRFTFGSQNDAGEALTYIFDTLGFPSVTLTKEAKPKKPKKNSDTWKTPSGTDKVCVLRLPMINVSLDESSTMKNKSINTKQSINMKALWDDYSKNGEIDWRYYGDDKASVMCHARIQITGLKKLANGIIPIQCHRSYTGSVKIRIPSRLNWIFGGYFKSFDADQFRINTKIKDAFTLEIQVKTRHLIGFVIQSGGVSGGHYVAWVCKGGKWYLTDDSRVREKTEEEAKEAAEDGYLFFYK